MAIGDLTLYETFNYAEGVVWWMFAVGVQLLIPSRDRKQKLALGLASVGFVLFGLSDFLEAPRAGMLPWWLWGLKVVSAAMILASRYHYIGWKQFRMTDRFFLFGLFCLICVVAIIWMQNFMGL